MADYVNNKTDGELMEAADLEAIETAIATKQDKDIGTNDRSVVSGSAGLLEVSTTTKTEIGYVGGVTSSIQTQLDAKQAVAVGTNDRALETSATGDIQASAVTTTELALLSGETDLHPTGTESAQGELELNTNAETVTGTDTTRACHAAGVKAAIDAGTTALIASSEVTGSAVQNIDISGLDLDTHGKYRIEIDTENASASTAAVSIQFNGDTTTGNYDYQSLSGTGTTASAFAGAASLIGSLLGTPSGGDNAYIQGYLTRNQTFNRCRFSGAFYRGDSNTDMYVTAFTITNDNITANITSIRIASSVAASLAVGTTVKIFREG